EEPKVLRVVAAVGEGCDGLTGLELRVPSTVIGSVFTAGKPRIINEFVGEPDEAPVLSRLPRGPIFLVPLGTAEDVRGVLIVGKAKGQPAFPEPVVRLLEAFAGQAAVVLELAEARREAERYSLIDDRARIARDLHDVVIQRLFATAMTLAGAARLIDQPEAASRVQLAVDDLDETIRQIRSTIFALQTTEPSGGGRLRARVTRIVEAASEQLGFAPAVQMEGLLDTDVPDDLADEVGAVLQEALSNVVRHARA